MATFNAGSIDATLTLDRSPFAEGLRLARAEADAFEGDPINVSLDLGSTAELDRLREQIAALDGKNIRLDVNTSGTAELEKLREDIDTLNGKGITIDANTAGAAAKIDRLRESISTLDKSVDIDVNTAGALAHLATFRAEADAMLAGISGNVNMGGGGSGGGGSDGNGFGGLGSAPGMMLTAIATLAPIAAAAIVPLTAVVAGLASAMTSAGTGVGVLALGVIPVITGFKKMEDQLKTAQTALDKTVPGTKQYAAALTNVNNIQTALNEQYGPMVVGLASLKGAWNDFKDATHEDAMGLIVQGMGVAQALLPKLLPIWSAFTPVISDMLTHLRYFIAGPEMARFLAFVQKYGPDALVGLIDILKNLGGMFVHLVEAFAPFAKTMIGGLDDITLKWDQWASHLQETKGFHDFIDYAMKNGPVMLQTLKDVAVALVHIGEGIAPLAGPNMVGLRILADTISKLPPDVITALAIGFEAWAVGMWAYTAATTAAAIATTILDIAASPIILMFLASAGVVAAVVVGVIALAIGIYELATKTQFFQTIWSAVWGAAKVTWDWLVDAFHVGVDGIVTAWNWLTGVMSTAWGTITGIWSAVVGGISAGVGAIVGAWDAVTGATSAAWDWVVGVITGAGDMIAGAVSALVDAVRTVWNTFWGSEFGQLISAVLGLVVAMFQLEFAIIEFVVLWFVEAVKTAWGAVVDAFNWMNGVVAGVMSAIGTAITTAWNAVVTFMTPILSSISSATSTAWGAVSSAVSTAVGAVRSAVSTAWGAVSSATTTAWDAVSGATSTVWHAVSSVVSTVAAAVRGFVKAGWDYISSHTVSVWNAVYDAIDGPLGKAKTAVSGAITAIKGFFDGAATWLVHAGAAIIDGLITGITSKINDLKNAVTGLTSIITDHLPGSPVKEGPLRVLNEGYAGGQITAMLADGINAKAHLVRNAVSDLADIAGMQLGGTGYINGRLGINNNTVPAATTNNGLDLTALLEEMQAMREATERMTDEFGRQNDNMVVLARQGLQVNR